MRKASFLLVMALLFMPVPVHGAAFQVAKRSDSVVDPAALTIQGGFGQCINGLSFQQHAVLTERGYQYVAYYGVDRWVSVARRALPGGTWEVVRLKDYKFESNDAHNVISMGICTADGTIHLSFDHHGHPLRYRVSRKGVASSPGETRWDEALFGAVRSELRDGESIPSVTYPRFWQTPEGGIQFCYRRGGSGNGDRMLADYDSESGQWSTSRQIDSREGMWTAGDFTSESRCSYPNGYDYGPDGKLHMTWVWRERADTANHDLMYAYSEDRGVTWKNNAGLVLSEPARLDSPGITVYPISHELGLMNTHGQAVDSNGRIHTVMWHCTEESLAAAGSAPGEHRWGPPEARRYHHYWRRDDGAWRHQELPGVAGNRPKAFFDGNDNLYVIYGGLHGKGMELHDAAALNILAASGEKEWADWQTIHVESGPFLNEMLYDPTRWKSEGVLSVMVQEPPAEPHQPTPLRILDFTIAGP